MTLTKADSDKYGQLKDLVESLPSSEYPFLKHLPRIILPYGTLPISISHALQFTKLALEHDKLPVVSDALGILNQLVSPIDGSFIKPSINMFYDNRTFFWSALGTRKKCSIIIKHINTRFNE